MARYLDVAADLDGVGLGFDAVAEPCRPEVVDGELHAGHPAVPGRHVPADARGRLRDQRRHAAVEHLERLAAGLGDGEAAQDLLPGDAGVLEAQRVQRVVRRRAVPETGGRGRSWRSPALAGAGHRVSFGGAEFGGCDEMGRSED